MSTIANIIVQLIHIEGPFKGEIQEFACPQILIGRHPDCQVQFPKDAVMLSRKHAKIVRESNHFKLIDQSTNGTFVNGQQITETYLKEGDVFTFFEGGPKVSFLTQTLLQPAPCPQTPPVAPPVPVTPASAPTTAPPDSAAAPPSSSSPTPQNVTPPFVVQYGPTIKSFQSLPITLGKAAHHNFVINHPAVHDQHAQVYLDQGQYWIKDLTGANTILIDNIPISGMAQLQPDTQLALSPQGPRFRFLGGGRLVEVEAPLPEARAPETFRAAPETSSASSRFESMVKKTEAVFKKIVKGDPALFSQSRKEMP